MTRRQLWVLLRDHVHTNQMTLLAREDIYAVAEANWPTLAGRAVEAAIARLCDDGLLVRRGTGVYAVVR